DRIWLQEGDRKISYAQSLVRVNQVANGLDALGLEIGAKCGVLSRNSADATTVMYGIIKSGRVWVPLHTADTADHMTYILLAFDAEILFYEAEFAPFVETIRKNPGLIRHFICLD